MNLLFFLTKLLSVVIPSFQEGKKGKDKQIK
jgi:hypothetical protein